MKWLRATCLAFVILLGWTTISFVISPWHRIYFNLESSDSSITPVQTASEFEQSRKLLDSNIIKFLMGGDSRLLNQLPVPEQAHMIDVRNVWRLLVGLTVLGIAWIAVAKPYRYARLAVVATGGFGLVTFLSFNPVFDLVHKLFFAHGNWQFSDQSPLILTYPYNFFLFMWLSITCLALLTLLAIAYAKNNHEHH